MANKPRVGFYGISGCSGCLLTVLYEDCFLKITRDLDIKNFPFIFEERYSSKLDYCFIEGTVCFDEDIERLKELRKRSKKIIALGSCACFGCVPSMKNFKDSKKITTSIYPKYNHLKSVDPTPIHKHIKVDHHIPQCPPSKEEILKFIKCIKTKKEFKLETNSVCTECEKRGTPKCLLIQGKICLGPLTANGCGALCPNNQTTCYGCRGPHPNANYEGYLKLIKTKKRTKKEMQDKLETFAGLTFQEAQKK